MSAEMEARRTAAAAVLADFRRELATAPLSRPPGREWMFRLEQALGDLLDELGEPSPEPAELAPAPACAHGWPGETCGQAHPYIADPLRLRDLRDPDDTEPYCTTCGEWCGLFLGLEGWHHFHGDPAPGGQRELYEADHSATVGWRQAGGAIESQRCPCREGTVDDCPGAWHGCDYHDEAGPEESPLARRDAYIGTWSNQDVTRRQP